MNESQYQQLSQDLQHIVKNIPSHWGRIQNNKTDSKLDMFSIQNIEELERLTKHFKEADKNYYRRRWFLWQCANVDEYLFYNQSNIKRNPERKSKEFDIEFNSDSKLRFDIKGTVVPKKFRDKFDPIKDENKIIEFYYSNQSKGIRYHIQNRLFIVHHSFKNNERSKLLRCHWLLKEKAFGAFAQSVSMDFQFVPFNTSIAKCIFIIESIENEYYFHFN